MATKTFTDFVRILTGKFQKEIPEIDPTIKASLSRAAVISSAAAAVSNQEGIKDAIAQSFWQTQDDEFLKLTGAYDNVSIFENQKSAGLVNATGVLSTIIPQFTPITYSGNSYLVLQDSVIQSYSGDIFLEYSSGLVTVTTDIDHTLATGQTVTISGATQTDYNGTFEITALNENTFTYDLIAGTLTTDNGIYTSEYAILNIESVGTGSTQNVGAGAIMTIDLTDVNDNVFVQIGEITGGLDEENIDELRIRVGEAHNLTPGIATAPALKFSAKSIPGNTRVFVIRPDGTLGGIEGDAGYKPQQGQTVIYILRDKDINILPNTAQLTTTKNKIISDELWPTFVQDSNLFVLAPILKFQNFYFTNIFPNTITMQNAISEQLKAFFEDASTIEGTILKSDIDIFLRQVQDPSTGQFLTSFSYSVPGADIVAGSGEIYTLGVVTYA